MTDVAEASLRERKKREVEADLTRAAMDLFTRHGFDGVTADQIAEAAGVSRRSFFRYFPSKEDVFFARRRAQAEALAALLAAPLPGEAGFDTIRRALLTLASEHVASRARILEEHAVLATAPQLIARDLQWDRHAERAFAAALGRGTATDAATQRRVRVCAGAIVGALRVVIEGWVARGCRGDLARLGEEALDWLAPLAPEPVDRLARRARDRARPR